MSCHLPATGCSPSLNQTSPLDRYSKAFAGPKVNWNLPLRASDTGRSFWDSPALLGSPVSKLCFPPPTPSPLALPQPMTTFGKKKRPWADDSTSAPSLSSETQPLTGRLYVPQPSPEHWRGSPMTSLYVITGISEESLETLQERYILVFYSSNNLDSNGTNRFRLLGSKR